MHEVGDVDAEFLAAPLRLSLTARGPLYAYRLPRGALERRGPFDLTFVDGPPRAYGRLGCLPLARPHLASPAVVALHDVHCTIEQGQITGLHDVHRRAERRVLRAWLAAYPGLDVVHCDTRLGRRGGGHAVLLHDGDPRERRSVRVFAAGWLEWIRALRFVHKRLRDASA